MELWVRRNFFFFRDILRNLIHPKEFVEFLSSDYLAHAFFSDEFHLEHHLISQVSLYFVDVFVGTLSPYNVTAPVQQIFLLRHNIFLTGQALRVNKGNFWGRGDGGKVMLSQFYRFGKILIRALLECSLEPS